MLFDQETRAEAQTLFDQSVPDEELNDPGLNAPPPSLPEVGMHVDVLSAANVRGRSYVAWSGVSGAVGLCCP